MHVKLGVPETKRLKITARAVKMYMRRMSGCSGISFLMGANKRVNLEVLNMK